MAVEDDDVVDAELPERGRASQTGRPGADDRDLVEARPSRGLVRLR